MGAEELLPCHPPQLVFLQLQDKGTVNPGINLCSNSVQCSLDSQNVQERLILMFMLKNEELA